MSGEGKNRKGIPHHAFDLILNLLAV